MVLLPPGVDQEKSGYEVEVLVLESMIILR